MKKNVHTAGKSRKQKKIMLLLLELLIICLLYTSDAADE